MIVRDKREHALLVEGGKRLATVLQKVVAMAVAGVTTKALDAEAERLIREGGDRPSFLGYTPSGASAPYPATLCTSVNDEIVHGLPSERVLVEGDIIGLDIGLVHEGLYLDMAVTVAVGTVPPAVQKLLLVTREALVAGIGVARAGARLGDIGAAISARAAPHNFGVVYDLGGHGVGRAVHEPPFIQNTGPAGKGEKLVAGMVLAIEPMFTTGSADIRMAADGSTYVTADGSLSAHFEHTILVTDNDPIILTQ